MNLNKVIIISLFVFLLGAIFVGASLMMNKNKQQLKKSINKELSTIAEIKVAGISNWYADEIKDVQIIAQNFSFVSSIDDYFNNNTIATKNKAQSNIEQIKLEHDYSNIYVVDNHLNFHFSTNTEEIPTEPILFNTVKQLETSAGTVSTGLYCCNLHNEIHLDFVTPLFNENNEKIGVVIFEINPHKYLFPFIQSWPLAGNTAETLLLRDEGDSIVFLNESRFQKNAALKLKISKQRMDNPAVNAVGGYEGGYEGVDYRNVNVISFIKKIPGTPWFLIAKVDEAELNQKLKASNNDKFVRSFVLILALISILAFLYSNGQKTNYKKQYLAQEEFKTTLYSIGDAVITTGREGKVKHMNPIAEQLTGWTEKESIGKSIEEVFNIESEETGRRVESPVDKVVREGCIVDLANHTLLIAKNGKRIPIADSGAPINDKQGNITGVVLVFRDQSEERDHQAIVEEQKRQLFTLMSNLPGMAYRCENDEHWTMMFVSNGCLELTGYTADELKMNNKVSYEKLIHPDDQQYVRDRVLEAIEKRTNFELEYKITTRSNKIQWVWERGQGIYNQNNELISIEGFISNISLRKETETALLESEQRLNFAQELAKVGSWEYDVLNNSGKWSDQMFKLYDLEIANKPPIFERYIELIHPEDTFLVRINLNRMSKGLIPEQIEYRTNPQKCTHRVLKTTFRLIRNEKGEIIKYTGTLSDITDIKAYQNELNETNSLMHTLINTIPDAIYVKDSEGRKVMVNKADLINVGVENEKDVIGKNDFDLFPPKIAEAFWKVDQEVLKKGKALYDVEEELVNVKNEKKWLATSKIPYRNEKGEVIGIIGIGHDITRRKDNELEKSKLLTALTQSPVSIVITNAESKIEYVNPKFTKVTGFTSDEVLGENPRILKSGTQPDEFYTEMWENLMAGNEWRSEFHNKKKNGEFFWENVIIAPIKDQNGDIINYVAVKEDITEKKRLHEELILAKNQAEESDQLKTSFLANMSHEIRTPLNSILGFTDIVIESEDLSPKERMAYTTIIRKSSDSLLQIINDIIDISSLETGQLTISNSEFEVNSVVNLLRMEYAKRIVDLKIDSFEIKSIAADEKLIIYSDQNRLNQILINLLTNAVKFTQKGYIEFGIERFDQERVYFKVEDTGIGIDPNLQSAIFERFRQVENNSDRKFGGNGLGLSIVKNLVELMGGSISLESKIGKGSVFRFNIPRKPPE